MRLPQAFLFLITLFTLGHALALPASISDLTQAANQLFKRKGGGGGGGRGGGSSSSTSSSSSSGSSGSSSGGSRSGSTSSTSNAGGSTRAGSGTTRGYGGGGYYGGGASTPYSPGTRRGGLGAPLLVGAGALAIFPALALYGAYSYGYPYYWTYRNQTSGQNETHPAQCWCARYNPCSCDSNNDTSYQNAVANNASVAKLATLPGNDSQTLVIDGTLQNGTTSPGGTDSGAIRVGEMIGWWPMLVAAVATVYVL